MSKDISQLRRDYAGKHLNKDIAGSDPIKLFDKWFEEALQAEVLDANAFTLSTISSNGRPSGRIVLIKGVVDGKFIFYTNYDSKKGKDLEANAVAAMTFYYKELDRQIRLEGTIEKVDTAESDKYFDSRPLKSRVGAWISEQSNPIPSRVFLMRKFAEYNLKNIGHKVKRPLNWGGYALSPDRIEFWQGRPNRLHDRINFTLQDGNWEIERLAP
jgi:pyridoxamine 5'-phosphate oxidase